MRFAAVNYVIFCVREDITIIFDAVMLRKPLIKLFACPRLVLRCILKPANFGAPEFCNRMKSVLVLHRGFPIGRETRLAHSSPISALAVTRTGWRVGVLVVRTWIPPYCQWVAGKMERGNIQGDAFQLAALETARVPSLPNLMLRPMTDIVSDRIVASALERMVRSICADVIYVQTEGMDADSRAGRAQARRAVGRDTSRH